MAVGRALAAGSYCDHVVLRLIGAQLSQAAQEQVIGRAVRLSCFHHFPTQLHHLIGQ